MQHPKRKPSQKQIRLVNLVTAVLLVLFLTVGISMKFVSPPSEQPQDQTQQEQTQTPEQPQQTQEQPAQQAVRTSFYAVGDNLIHKAIFAPAQTSDGTYDFTKNYQYVKDSIQAADIAIINQETVINDYAPPEHYPTFSTPIEMLQTIIDLGFDVANVATNHMLDQGKAGLINSLQHIQNSSLVASGAFLGEEDRSKVRTVSRNGMDFAFVGVTYGTNGIPVPKTDELLVNLIEDEQSIKEQITQAKEQSDFVIAMVHWGNEYADNFNQDQTAYAQKLADWGADLIIGHHPHVIQPIDTVTSADGRTVYVAYSLGNFISAQDSGKRLIGAGLSFDVVRDEDGTIRVENLCAEPLITQVESGFKNIRVYRFSDYTSTLASQHMLQAKGWALDYIADHFQTIMGDYAKIENSELAS